MQEQYHWHRQGDLWSSSKKLEKIRNDQIQNGGNHNQEEMKKVKQIIVD